ncbi:MAG: hypothetical protein WA944_00305 [Mycobacterium sp.]
MVRAGAARLDALVEENNATMAAAQRARTPAEDAAILRALRANASFCLDDSSLQVRALMGCPPKVLR